MVVGTLETSVYSPFYMHWWVVGLETCLKMLQSSSEIFSCCLSLVILWSFPELCGFSTRCFEVKDILLDFRLKLYIKHSAGGLNVSQLLVLIEDCQLMRIIVHL